MMNKMLENYCHKMSPASQALKNSNKLSLRTVRFEVIMAVKIILFWVVMVCVVWSGR